MPEFEISPEKLGSMQDEHAGNTYLSWVREEADSRCRRIFQERFTEVEIAKFWGKVEDLGGLDQMEDFLRQQPGYEEHMRRIAGIKSRSIQEMSLSSETGKSSDNNNS